MALKNLYKVKEKPDCIQILKKTKRTFVLSKLIRKKKTSKLLGFKFGVRAIAIAIKIDNLKTHLVMYDALTDKVTYDERWWAWGAAYCWIKHFDFLGRDTIIAQGEAVFFDVHSNMSAKNVFLAIKFQKATTLEIVNTVGVHMERSEGFRDSYYLAPKVEAGGFSVSKKQIKHRVKIGREKETQTYETCLSSKTWQVCKRSTRV